MTVVIKECQGCGQKALRKMFDLGPVPSVNTYYWPNEISQERPYLLDVFWCANCSLVQLGTIVPPEELFSHYQHLSAASQSNITHLQELANLLQQKYTITNVTKILDVGSNDGSLLAQFRDVTSHLLGVDPAANLIPYARKQGVEQIAAFLSEDVSRDIVKTHGAYDMVLALNVMAHTPNVRAILRAVREVLAPSGTFVMEAVYVFSTILKGEFDTVYHEHVYCFSLTALVPLFEQAGLTIVDVEQIPTQGGSLRVYAQRSERNPTIAPEVAALLAREVVQGVRLPETYDRIGREVEAFKRALQERLVALKEKHGRIIGLGAPARGVVILNACQIGPNLLAAVVDDTPLKQGRLVPGVHIPVIGWNDLADQEATAFLLLSWNYEQEILTKLRRYVASGEVLIPFPTVRTVTL